MKKILLQRLTLENFKNHKLFVLELGGKSVTVHGENAAGKSSLYDALTWLLFGKDSKGRGESEHFKPLDAEGNVRDHEAITAVTAELTVDGFPVTLKRTLQERWSAKRGSSTLSYDGNVSEYFVDGVPCKKFEFERRIGELVDEDVFRLLTELTYFVERLDWRKRRGILCDLSGAMSDADIMRTDARFAPLSEDMGALRLEDYKKKVAAERKGLLAVKNDTPARLSELGAQEGKLCAEILGAVSGVPARDCHVGAGAPPRNDIVGSACTRDVGDAVPYGVHSGDCHVGADAPPRNDMYGSACTGAPGMPRATGANTGVPIGRTGSSAPTGGASEGRSEAEAWAVLEGRREALEAEKETLSQQLYALRQDSALTALNADMMACRLRCAELEQKNGEYRKQQEEGRADVGRIRSDIHAQEKRLQMQRDELRRARIRAERAQVDLNAARERWFAVNDEQFTGGDCPTCGQSLPFDQLSRAKDSFEASKQRRLDEITHSAGIYQTALQDAEEYITRVEAEISALDKRLCDARYELAQAEQSAVAVTDLPGYAKEKAELQAELFLLEQHAEQMRSDSREAEQALLVRLAELRAELGRIASELAKKEVLEMTRRRIAELRENAKQAAERLEQVERRLWLVEEFTRYKTKFVEDSINSLFCLTQFRLFREQANGGVEERCDAVYNGVPYADLNDGMKVNVGMDVIESLSRLYGVSVPLFIDNAERVTDWKISPETQVIYLKVTEGARELRCEYES